MPLRKIIFILCFIVAVFKVFNTVKAQDNLLIKSIISVYDGDTFKVDLFCDSPMNIFCKDISIRVLGVDTPEIKGKCEKEKKLAQAAKHFTDSFLRSGTVVLRDVQRDKYFRVLAHVFVDCFSLSELLVLNKLGVFYNGGTKEKNWCEVKK